MTARRAYPTDISDARWSLIGPTLLAWQQARLDRRPTGEPARTAVREVINAIFYVNRTGIAWKYLPHDFPPPRCTTAMPLGAMREFLPSLTSI